MPLYDKARTFAPLTLDELARAVAAMPIAFMEQGDAYVPVALMGLHDGHNLYVGADGHWHATYRPAVLSLQPFQAMPSADGQRLVCVDEHSGLLTESEEGEAFFDSSGAPSAALQRIIEALSERESALARTEAACAELQRHALLEPWDIEIATPVGTHRLQGVFRINATVLNSLSASSLASLHACGALNLAHAQRFSMVQLDCLIERLLHRELTVQANPRLLASAIPAPPLTGKRVLLVTHAWNTLIDMAAMIKQAGCMVDVLCPASSTTIRNGFYDGWIDSGPTLDTLLLALVQLTAQQRYDQVVIGDDPILWAIVKRPIQALFPLLPIHKPEAWPMISKVGFSRHCSAHDIVTPAFYVVETADDVAHALAALGLPLVLKKDYSSGSHGVAIIRDKASYTHFWTGHRFDEAVLAEAFIDGPMLPVEALFKHGRVLEYAVSVSKTTSLGPTTKRRYLEQDPVLSESLALLGESAGLHGFANMTYMQDASTGVYYLIESDMRPNIWTALCKWFGHDFAAAFRRFLADDDLPGERVVTLPPEACLDIEYFPIYAQKLLNEGRLMDAVLHLLDFQRTWRYVLDDPVQLENRMNAFRQGILAAM